MAYSDFTFSKVKEAFQLTVDEKTNLFADISKVQPSQILTTLLQENLSFAIAVGTEKARSEFIIAQILGEVRRQLNYREDIFGGVGQCIAAMVAAQIFNEQHHNQIPVIYGVVTSGTNWRFIKLKQNLVQIDAIEYYVSEVDKILGILLEPLRSAANLVSVAAVSYEGFR